MGLFAEFARKGSSNGRNVFQRVIERSGNHDDRQAGAIKGSVPAWPLFEKDWANRIGLDTNGGVVEHQAGRCLLSEPRTWGNHCKVLKI